MKKQSSPFNWLFVMLFAWTSISESQAANPNDYYGQEEPKTLLYKIEGQGIQTSYLFGTIHMLPKEDFVLEETVKEAFMSAKQVVLEVDMDDPSMQMEMLQHVQMKDGHSLNEYLSEEEMAKLDERIKKSTGVGISFFKNWLPYMTSTMLIREVIGQDPASFELTFLTMAKENELEVLGLETITDQLNIFHSIAYDEQAQMLLGYLESNDKLVSEFAALSETYLAKDVEGMRDLMEMSDTEGGLPTNLLLDQRNERWIPRMEEIAKEKSTFFAVGAGHLGGDKGVINLLREAGYTITPVE